MGWVMRELVDGGRGGVVVWREVRVGMVWTLGEMSEEGSGRAYGAQSRMFRRGGERVSGRLAEEAEERGMQVGAMAHGAGAWRSGEGT